MLYNLLSDKDSRLTFQNKKKKKKESDYCLFVKWKCSLNLILTKQKIKYNNKSKKILKLPLYSSYNE